MSFASPSAPARWFVYAGIFFRWLCVCLFVLNILGDYVSFIPYDIYVFSLSALGLLGVVVFITLIEVGVILWRKNNQTSLVKRHDLNFFASRYFLAFIFFSYGIAKLINQQFGSPYHILDRSVAELNGYLLSWRFFDYSFSYKFFIGMGQVIASALFLSRKTASLAAVIMLPIISNIVFVNFAFGVPVTFFSFCYLIFTIYILLCDFDRLNALFIQNNAFSSNPILQITRYRFFSTRGFKITRSIFVIAIICWPLSDYFKYMDERNINKGVTGSYKISNFNYVNNANCPDSIRWKKFFVEKWGGRGAARLANDKWVYFTNISFDEKKHKMKISFWDSIHYHSLQADYKKVNDDSISINGLWGKDSIRMNMKRYLK